MTTISLTTNAAALSGERAAAPERRHRGRRLAETIAAWRARARERRELASLDDRGLRDIGLTRGEIEAEINKPFWRD